MLNLELQGKETHILKFQNCVQAFIYKLQHQDNCQYSGHISALMFCAFLLRNSQ